MADSIANPSRAKVSDSTSAVAEKPSSSLLPLLDEIRELVVDDSDQDPYTRAQLLSKIHALNLTAESPLDTILRIGYQSWQAAAIRVALDLDVFHALVNRNPDPVTAEEMASKHGADVVLVGTLTHECALMTFVRG